MKVYTVSDDGLPPYRYGGIQYYVKEMAGLVAKSGHEVEVFTAMAPPVLSQYPFRVNAVRPYGNFWAGPLSALRTYPVAYNRFRQALDARLKQGPRPDLIHAHNPFISGRAGVMTSRKWKIPSVLHYYYSATMDHFLAGRSITLPERAAGFGIHGYNRYLVNSHCMRDALVSRFKLEADKIDVLPLFVDTDTFRPDTECKWVRTRYNIPPEIPLILAVNRIEPHKGHEHLARAFAQTLKTQDAFLLIVGDGSYAPEIKKLCTELGIQNKVFFTGQVTAGELPGFYAAADIFVNPALDENYSFVVLEAAASGKPIIGMRHPVMEREFHGEGHASFLCPPGNEDELAAAMNNLLSHADLRTAMGREARQRAVAAHSLDAYTKKLLAVYGKVINAG